VIAGDSQHIKGESGLTFTDMNTILKESDIVFVCVSRDAGESFVGKDELALMKDGALLVSFMAPGIIDEEALLAELKQGRIRAVSDHPMKNPESNNLPLGTWYSFNGSNAFNTFSELKLCSDTATEKMIELLFKVPENKTD